MKWIVYGLIVMYQKLTFFLPRQCRFVPSCSEYTKQSILRYGIFYGIFKGLVRILKCHPFHPGGYDPVV